MKHQNSRTTSPKDLVAHPLLLGFSAAALAAAWWAYAVFAILL